MGHGTGHEIHAERMPMAIILSSQD
jgi:hypothetical protein